MSVIVIEKVSDMEKMAEKTRIKQYQTALKKSSLFIPPEEAGIREEDRIGQTNFCVLGPSINAFVIWLLQDAVKRGIKRLYFLARDGYFMYHAAKILCQKTNLSIECHYLYCSRYSIRIPMFHMNLSEAMDYICRGGIDVTMRKILNRSGISLEEQEEVLRRLQENPPVFQENEVIPYAKLGEVRKALETCSYFIDCVIRHSKEALPGLEGYLRQEGLLQNVERGTDAVVDSGWVGSMQKVLNQVLHKFGRKDGLKGYYWGLYELPDGVCEEDYFCYYFSPKKYLREKVYFSNCLFEAIFSAPHGMTIGYEVGWDVDAIKGIYSPCFGFFDNERREFMRQTETYFLKYTEALSETLKDTNDLLAIDCQNDKKTVRKLMYFFMGKPTYEEASIYGKLRFSDDVMDNASRQVAEPLNEKELCANHAGNKILVMFGLKQEYIKESAWLEGSIAKHRTNRAYHQLHCTVYKYLLYLRKTYWS